MSVLDKLSYSKKQAAAVSSLSVRKIEYFIEQGRLRATKVDRRVVICAKSLQKLLDGGVAIQNESV